jgi:putative tryptophan/tyrosine transport system substrate-binding protein
LAAQDRTAAFVRRLHEAGWIEGRSAAIEYRWADGQAARLPVLATELVRLKVDVIVTWGSGPVIAAKKATWDTPIVFAIAADPVGNGLVASLARPGGNVTGLSNQAFDLAAKRLEILREIVPGLRRLGVLANGNSPAAAREMQEVRAVSDAQSVDTVAATITNVGDIANAFAVLDGFVDALYVCADPLVNTNRTEINDRAIRARLPTTYVAREYVDAGGLMSYGPSLPDLFRRAAEYVDKILRGAPVSDLPVEQPTKFELVMNVKTAKALGLEIPPTLLARADEVIE